MGYNRISLNLQRWSNEVLGPEDPDCEMIKLKIVLTSCKERTDNQNDWCQPCRIKELRQ